MSCDCPVTAYRGRFVSPNGKRPLVFKRDLAAPGLLGEPLKLPCGRCGGCRLEKARQWAVRCMNEKRMWTHNAFVTLTYNPANLPPGGTLVKRDLCLFMKRLRLDFNSCEENPVRFYACGEYGDKDGRPHYHALLFNCHFADQRYFKEVNGYKLYTSARLEGIWQKGFCTVGDVTFESASYVARYIMKKWYNADPENVRKHYEVVNVGTGEVFDRIPEFTVMSRRPGIGSAYYDKYGGEIRAHDNLIIRDREVRPPRFYDTRSEAIDPVGFAKHKRVRLHKALRMKADNTVDRRRVKAALRDKLLSMKGRTL